MKLSHQLARVLESLGEETSYTVKHGEEHSPLWAMDDRLPQGSCWSPLLACLSLDSGPGRALRSREAVLSAGVPKLDGRKTTNSFFADDLALFAGSAWVMNELIRVLVWSSELENFKINYEKCELLCFEMAKKMKTPPLLESMVDLSRTPANRRSTWESCFSRMGSSMLTSRP
jgi:hypothetical protein